MLLILDSYSCKMKILDFGIRMPVDWCIFVNLKQEIYSPVFMLVLEMKATTLQNVYTKLHGIISQKTVIFVETNIAYFCHRVC